MPEGKVITLTMIKAGRGVFEYRGQTLHDLVQQFDSNPTLSWLSTESGIRRFLANRADTSYLPVDSAAHTENIIRLQTQPASLRAPLSLLLGGYNFLFVPIPFVDDGSFFLIAQFYEGYLWYFYHLILITLSVGPIRRRYVLNLVILSLALFSPGYIVISALIEDQLWNLRTASSGPYDRCFGYPSDFQQKQPERPKDQNSSF